jgi:GNAT superfamily N-acetyltransferase
MEIVFYEDKHLDQIVDFIRKVWDKDYSKEKFLKERHHNLTQNPYGKEGGLPITIAIEDNQIVGHLARIPCGFWLNGKELLGYWLAGIHVLSEFRGKGLGKNLPRKIIEKVSIVTGFFVVEASLKIWQHLGWTVVGKIPEYIKFIRPYHFIMKVDFTGLAIVPNWIKKLFKFSGKIGRLILALPFSLVIRGIGFFQKIDGKDQESGNVKLVEQFDERLDQLWEKNKPFIKYCQVRKSDYLNWMFKPEYGWKKFVYEVDSEVLGYAIVTTKSFEKGEKLANVQVTSIIDLFWDFQKENVLRILLADIEKYACDQNSEVLICSINHQNAQDLLKKQCYREIPSSVFFAYYSDFEEIKETISPDLNDWFLTRGDADAAGSLVPRIKKD